MPATIVAPADGGVDSITQPGVRVQHGARIGTLLGAGNVTYPLTASITGKVTATFVKAGQQVVAGAALLKIG